MPVKRMVVAPSWLSRYRCPLPRSATVGRGTPPTSPPPSSIQVSRWTRGTGGRKLQHQAVLLADLSEWCYESGHGHVQRSDRARSVTCSPTPCDGQWSTNPSTRRTLSISIRHDRRRQRDRGPSAASDPTLWPSDSFDIGMVSGTDPFLVHVSSATGIVAEQAYTWTESNNYGARIIDECHYIEEFINVCIDGGYTLYSENGGDLYWVVYSGSGTTTRSPGWPPRPCSSRHSHSAGRSPRDAARCPRRQ